MNLDPVAMYTILGLATIALATTMLALPVGTCSRCDHCRSDELRRRRQAEERASKLYGVPFCQVCGRIHGPDERPH
jgi:hypothetical protein